MREELGTRTGEGRAARPDSPVCSERCRDNVCCRPNTFPHTSQGKSWSLNFQDGNPLPASSTSFSVSGPKQQHVVRTKQGTLNKFHFSQHSGSKQSFLLESVAGHCRPGPVSAGLHAHLAPLRRSPLEDVMWRPSLQYSLAFVTEDQPTRPSRTGVSNSFSSGTSLASQLPSKGRNNVRTVYM